MTRFTSAFVLAGLCVWSAALAAQRPARDLLNARAPEVERTRILVLGTPHLASLKVVWNPHVLDGLLAALERFRPDVIAVERMPPAVIDAMASVGGRAREVAMMMVSSAVTRGRRTQEQLGLSRIEAEARVVGLLQRLAVTSEAGARTRLRAQLAVTLIAALDEPSAGLQWSYLSSPARREVRDIPADLVDHLNALADRANETASIAATLARRLSLERLVGMDDHQEAATTLDFWDQLSAELERSPEYRAAGADPLYEESNRRFDAAYAAGDLLPHYRWINSGAFTDADVDRQFGLYLRTRLPSGLDRARLAQWEVRNIRMAAHIREASARLAGGRVLVIVGVAHKPFLDQYLAQFSDVRLMSLESLTVQPAEE